MIAAAASVLKSISSCDVRTEYVTARFMSVKRYAITAVTFCLAFCLGETGAHAEETLTLRAARLPEAPRVNGWPDRELWEGAEIFTPCSPLRHGPASEHEPTCVMALWQEEALFFRWQRDLSRSWQRLSVRFGPEGEAGRWLEVAIDPSGSVTASVVQLEAGGQRVSQPWAAAQTLSHRMNTHRQPGVLRSTTQRGLVLRIPAASLASLNWDVPASNQRWRVEFFATTGPPPLITRGWYQPAAVAPHAPGGRLILHPVEAPRIVTRVLGALSNGSADAPVDAFVDALGQTPPVTEEKNGDVVRTPPPPQPGGDGAIHVRPTVRWVNLSVTENGGDAAASLASLFHRYLRRHSGSYRYCIERRWRDAGRFEGEWTWEVEQNPAGRVTRVELVSSSIEDTALKSCLERKLLRMRLPAADTSLVYRATAVIRERLANPPAPAR